MTVETATSIFELDPDSPPNTDPRAEGAAQIRLLKEALQAQFSGFLTNATVASTQAEIDAIAHAVAGVVTSTYTVKAVAFMVGAALIGSPMGVPVIVGGDLALTDAHGVVVFTNPVSANAFLPAPGGRVGKVFALRHSAASGSVIIVPAGGGLVDGAASQSIAGTGTRWVQSDGTNWHTIASGSL